MKLCDHVFFMFFKYIRKIIWNPMKKYLELFKNIWELYGKYLSDHNYVYSTLSYRHHDFNILPDNYFFLYLSVKGDSYTTE